jgi:hypothetical protein
MTDYATIKKQHDETIPIGGWRKKHGVDCRPLTVRRRTWECWYAKDGWTGMVFRRCYPQYDAKQIKGYVDEVMPLLMMNENGVIRFTPKYMYSYTTWNIVSALLPDSIKFVKYGAKQYFKLSQPDGEPMYYFNNGLDMTFVPYESNGVRYYKLTQGVVTESRVKVDRDKAKQVKKDWAEFLNYFQPMADLLGFDPEKQNWKTVSNAKDLLEEAEWLARKDGEEYGDKWIDAIQAFLYLHTRRNSKWNKTTDGWDVSFEIPTSDTLREKLVGEHLYKVTRPFYEERVPVGKPFFKNYR